MSELKFMVYIILRLAKIGTDEAKELAWNFIKAYDDIKNLLKESKSEVDVEPWFENVWAKATTFKL
jgi:hypothetical protein